MSSGCDYSRYELTFFCGCACSAFPCACPAGRGTSLTGVALDELMQPILCLIESIDWLLLWLELVTVRADSEMSVGGNGNRSKQESVVCISIWIQKCPINYTSNYQGPTNQCPNQSSQDPIQVSRMAQSAESENQAIRMRETMTAVSQFITPPPCSNSSHLSDSIPPTSPPHHNHQLPSQPIN